MENKFAGSKINALATDISTLSQVLTVVVVVLPCEMGEMSMVSCNSSLFLLGVSPVTGLEVMLLVLGVFWASSSLTPFSGVLVALISISSRLLRSGGFGAAQVVATVFRRVVIRVLLFVLPFRYLYFPIVKSNDMFIFGISSDVNFNTSSSFCLPLGLVLLRLDEATYSSAPTMFIRNFANSAAIFFFFLSSLVSSLGFASSSGSVLSTFLSASVLTGVISEVFASSDEVMPHTLLEDTSIFIELFSDAWFEVSSTFFEVVSDGLLEASATFREDMSDGLLEVSSTLREVISDVVSFPVSSFFDAIISEPLLTSFWCSLNLEGWNFTSESIATNFDALSSSRLDGVLLLDGTTINKYSSPKMSIKALALFNHNAGTLLTGPTFEESAGVDTGPKQNSKNSFKHRTAFSCSLSRR
nr:unnamed protein product [Callosobruchus analis]